MDWSRCLVLLCLAVFCFWFGVHSQSTTGNGYRLQSDPTYMIIAPGKVYPDEVLQVQVTIFKLYYTHINVRASIRMEGVEHASFMETFHNPSTRMLQMQMPPNTRPGNYTMRVEGSINGGLSGNIFENETDIIFDVKQASVFITTNKPLYCQGQKVMFRIIPVRPNLLAAHGSMDVYAVDPTNTVVRRWLSMQSNQGLLEMELQLSDQPAYGTWKIRVKAFGTPYEKEFHVEEFYMPRMYVNVSMPMYILDNDFGVAGVITANHTSGRPVRGSGRIHMEIRDPLRTISPNKTYNWPSIDTELTFFEGKTTFLYTMDELTDLLGKKPTNKEIFVNVTIGDWFLLLNESSFGICAIYNRLVTMKLLGDPSRTFKPGFPVTVYYAVVNPDGSPLQGNRRTVSIQRITRSLSKRTRSPPEEKFMVPDNGIVEYTFVAEDDAESVKLRAYYDTDSSGSPRVECIMWRVYTHYGNYIHLSTSTRKPEVNQYMVFTVKTSVMVDKVYFLIVAAGNIVVGNMLEMKAKQKTFSVALSRDMVPSARIIAYYVGINGEVAADSLNFFVNGTRQNKVEVRINMGKDFSRDTVEVTGITDPGSYIAFQGLDYDLYTFGGNTFLTEKDIIEELETYDAGNASFSHTWYYGEEIYEKVYYPASTYGVDTNTTFSFAGLLIFSDANITRLPHPCNETLGSLPCNDGGCYMIDQRCDGAEQCEDGVDEMGCPSTHVSELDLFTPPLHRINHITRHFREDGAWLWMSHFVKPDGRIDLKRNVPKEPMSWMVGALSVSRNLGLGVTTIPARHQSTRPFYIQVEMPELVIKGEQIGVRIALFNYWQVPLECLVTLHDSDYYRFIMVEDSGVVSSYNPRTTRGDIQTMVYVQSGKMKTIYMPVLPVVDGDLNVTVSATSFMGRDKVTRPLRVIYDGVTNYFNTPYLVDLINSGSMIIPDFDIPVPERFIKPEQREHLYVPGSPEAIISIVGDVVGPGFFEPVLNAENLMRMPYGGAEQNLFNFASNLYYLKYLKNTNQLKREVLQKALNGMNLALQRQMSYMNPEDGSFSMFRDYRKPTPSTWLSAMALEVLQNADEADWHLMMYIPTELLNKVSLFVCSQQDSSGGFNDQAPLYDRKMVYNITGDEKTDGMKRKISLTAQVVIALSQAKGVTGVARTVVDSARMRGTAFLERYVHDLKDPYQVALVGYALTVANSNSRNAAFRKLANLQREGQYWSAYPIPRNPTTTVTTFRLMQHRLINQHEAQAVEASAYALMIYLRKNLLKDSQSIMVWLQSMRNSIGGFAGTRDSIVALQALAEYGKRDTNRDLYNIRLTLEASSMSNWGAQVNLKRDNWQDTQFVSVSRVWGQVRTVVQGTGIALMQMHTKVNVEYARQLEPRPNGTFFAADIDNINFHGKNFSILEMTACTKWLRPDLAARSGMVVMEINIPTGFIILNNDLRQYVRSGVVPNLGRAEYFNRKINFYLDYVEANRRTCVYFRADRWYPVGNATIQHHVKVYDFYEPGMFNRTVYTTYNLFNLHICQVCGSFQCPYCPFYNTATVVRLSFLFSIALAMAALLLPHYVISRS